MASSGASNTRLEDEVFKYLSTCRDVGIVQSDLLAVFAFFETFALWEPMRLVMSGWQISVNTSFHSESEKMSSYGQPKHNNAVCFAFITAIDLYVLHV